MARAGDGAEFIQLRFYLFNIGSCCIDDVWYFL